MPDARHLAGHDGPARSTGCSRETYPDARCELDFDNPFELLVVTVLSAQTTDRRVNAVRPTLFAAYPDAAAMAGRRPRAARADHRPARLLPGQDRVAAQAVARPSSSATTARCRRGSRTWSRCPASAARPPTSCSATPSASPASPSTPTSAGWPAASAGPSETDPVKVEHEVGALFPKKRLDDAVPPPDLARPPGLPRPQPRLRRLPGRALVPGVRRGADRPGEAAQAGEDRGPRMRRLVLVAAGLPAAGARCVGRRRRSASAHRRPGHQPSVDVDTPALRALKAPAGDRAPAARGTAAGAAARRHPALPRRRPRRRPRPGCAGPLVVNLCAQWCGPCRKEMPYYQAAAPQGTATRSRARRRLPRHPARGRRSQLAQDTGVTYPLLADPGGAAARRPQVRGLPGSARRPSTARCDVEYRLVTLVRRAARSGRQSPRRQLAERPASSRPDRSVG